jgi:hypothetical protein
MVVFLAACGSSSGPQALTPSGPWSPELATVFDDTIDFVLLRTILGTSWFDEYGAQLERRLDEADIIAVVAVRSMAPAQADEEFGSMEVEVEHVFRGGVAPGARLVLELPGSATARFEEERSRVEEAVHFVAYVRLYADEAAAVRNHWHLSLKDNDLLGTIRRVLRSESP